MLLCGDYPRCCWKCLKNKAIIRCSQHGLIKWKLCLNLMSFYKKVTCFVAEGFTCLEQIFCWTGSFHLKHHDLESLKCKENVLGVCIWKMRSYNCMGKAGCFLAGDKFYEVCVVTVGATTVYLRFSKWVVIIQMLTDLKWSPLTVLGIMLGMVLTSKWEMTSTNRRLEPYVTMYFESYLCMNFLFFFFLNILFSPNTWNIVIHAFIVLGWWKT